MRRPDQDRFDMFARHFESLDAYLVSFCETHNFQLERNFFRQPSMVLKRDGNPAFLVDIGLSEHWLKANFEEDMLHTIIVIAYYKLPDGSNWRMAHDVVSQERFSILKDKLPNYLQEALRLINEWTPEVIMQKGQRWDDLKKKYSE